ncbi:MAG: precorrin-3B C(17)-methyltransferase [Calditerrivibrio sp.]|nr:precorrin-3B C(17)-methyltransferase [Calditerrivibrio sp.]MCA1932722.1 precorrin-3B C(17)-methyltransferase [Calditerrivibrio sp.]
MKGKLFVVGTGPGDIGYMTKNAFDAIKISDYIVGYTVYVDLIKELICDKKIFSTGMGQEIDRVKFALEKVNEGYTVSIISGGDSSLYGLASLSLEISEEIDCEIIPGVTAAFAASAKLGSPITEDLVILSLSDQLTPRSTILKRIDAANQGDFVIAIYNPRSKRRKDLLPYAINTFMESRGDLPVGIVKECTRLGEVVKVTKLSMIDYDEIDMFTVLIVGNSKTYIKNGKMITPRGYMEKYETA